mgnify:CR=1 FL=1
MILPWNSSTLLILIYTHSRKYFAVFKIVHSFVSSVQTVGWQRTNRAAETFLGVIYLAKYYKLFMFSFMQTFIFDFVLLELIMYYNIKPEVVCVCVWVCVETFLLQHDNLSWAHRQQISGHRIILRPRWRVCGCEFKVRVCVGNEL